MPPRTERFALPGAHAAALLIGLTALAYLNSFSGVPQFDDYAVIVDEPRVATIGAWWDSMPGMRPLLKASYALNNSLDGVFGFHLANLAIHVGNVLLAWRLLLRLLPAGSSAAALPGALLFALHPVNSEAVTLLSGRSVALGAFGMLASLLALLEGRMALSLALFAASVLVRETALVLPALALLGLAWIGWREQREDALLHALRTCRWHWLLALGALGLLLSLPRYRELLDFSLNLRAPLSNLVTGSGAALYLLLQLARPFASNSDPRLPVFHHWDGYWIAVCALWLLVLAWSLVRVRRGSWLAFSLTWFVIALAPTNTLIARIDIANERQLYLAALPLYAGLVLAWQRIAGRVRSCGAVAAALLVCVLLVATVLRNRDYRSEAAFWSAVLARDADNSRAWNNLGFALEHEQDDVAGALAAYGRAILIDPVDYKPRHNVLALCARLPQEPGCRGR